MFIKYSILLYQITILLFFSKIGYSQQTTLALDHAYTLLAQQNIDIKQARIQLLLSQQDRIDAKNSLLPTLSLGAGHNYNLGLAFDQIAGQLVTGNRWSNNANASIRMNATLFQGFTRSNQIKNTLLNVESSELEVSRLTKSLRLELLSLYFDAIVNLFAGHQIKDGIWVLISVLLSLAISLIMSKFTITQLTFPFVLASCITLFLKSRLNIVTMAK